ncbi:MAG: ATP synthase F1 subunit epsilon [Spirochaetaceae bacterium]|jgi:F-type H+-transporting ATPase subunit epsilon|nr:ATP synthase F1 subunit epsilon [Spirochaetaceae bacterium]
MSFILEVHTPLRLFFSGPVEAVITTLMDGEAGIYANHSPFTSPVMTGILKIKDEKGLWKEAFITDGILEVKRSRTVLLIEHAEWPGEIDIERAEKARSDALAVLEAGAFRFETESARTKLKRANIRLAIAKKKTERP